MERVTVKKSSIEATELGIRDGHHEDPNGRERGEDSYLKKLSWKRCWYWIGLFLDILLALFPISFIILAALALTLQDQPKSARGERIVQATLLSPTIFPVMYAVVVWRLLRRMGLYKTERGKKRQTLDRPMSRQSVFTANRCPTGLLNVDSLGIFLIILWFLSPLGGQTSLRLLSKNPRVVPIDDIVRYFPTEAYARSYLIGIDVAIETWPRYGPLYMASLIKSGRSMNQSTDLWGAVKIPDIDLTTETLQGDWQSFGNDNHGTYTSLFGIPVAGIPKKGNTTFEISSHYWSVDCGEFLDDSRNWTADLNPNAKYSSFKMELPKDSNARQSTINFTYTTLKENILDDRNASIATSNCSARIVFLESLVNCAGQDCRVDAVRRAKRTEAPYPSYFLRMALQLLPGSDIGATQLRKPTSQSELVERWIMDPSTTFEVTSSPDEVPYVNLASLPSKTFSKRLQMMINTYFDSTTVPYYRTGNLTSDTNFTICSLPYCVPDVTFNSTQLTGVTFDGEKYLCSKIFAILTIVISLILSMSATIFVVLMSGLINTVAARMFGDGYVTTSKVGSEKEVGHLALATAEMRARRLDKQRPYE